MRSTPSPGRARSSSSVSSLSSALPHASRRAPGSDAVATERSRAPSPAPPTTPRGTTASARVRLEAEKLSALFGASKVVRDVSIAFRDREVTAIIGPSGCGKSTLLRCLNRMHETVPTARVRGRVLLAGADGTPQDVYTRGVDAIAVRRRVGMVFQRPTPFPTLSVRDNVAAGLRVAPGGMPSRREVDRIVEDALRRAALWDEVKDRLRESATGLSGGQQQRLCIARAIAVDPEVILMDEPCSALDPIATGRIEDLMAEIKSEYTIIIVTHNMQQAARV